MKKRERIDTAHPQGLTFSPFSGLAPVATDPSLPAAPSAFPPPDVAPPARASGVVGARLVVRSSRAGRGGKTVTWIEGLSAAQLNDAEFLRGLKQHLGCGAFCEDDRVGVQGEHQDAIRAFLIGQGAKSVVIGSEPGSKRGR